MNLDLKRKKMRKQRNFKTDKNIFQVEEMKKCERRNIFLIKIKKKLRKKTEKNSKEIFKICKNHNRRKHFHKSKTMNSIINQL